MSQTKRIKSFFIEILKLYRVIIWLLCMGLNSFFFLGYIILNPLIKYSWMDVKFSTLFRENPNYGRESIRTYTHRQTNTIYDSYGNAIGSVETAGRKTYSTVKDTESHHTRIIPFFFYATFYPFTRIITIILAFLAIFIKKYYIASEPSADYKYENQNNKRRKALYTWFNVIVVN